MKKLLCVLLSMVLCIGLMAGCGAEKEQAEAPAEAETSPAKAETESGEKKVIRVSWWGSQNRADITTEVCEMYMAEHPDVEIQVEFTDYNGYFDKLSVEAASGTIPDIFQASRDNMVDFTNKELMLPLDPYVESGILDFTDVSESAKVALTRNGQLYGIVLGTNSACMAYDPAVTQQAGVEITDAMPWSEFVEAARTIYEKTGVQTAFDSGDPITQLAMIARAQGYQLYSEDGKAMGFPDASVAIEYFKRYEDGLKEGYIVNPQIYVERDVGAQEQRPIVDGKVWNDFAWSNCGPLNDAMVAAGKTIELVSVPVRDEATTPANYLRVGTSFHVSKNTKYPEVCADFLNFFMNSVEANRVLKAERGTPVNSKVLEDLSAGAEGFQKVNLSFMAKVGPYCSPYSVFDPSAQSEIVDLLKTTLEKVGYGKLTAEEAGEEFFEQANALLQKG